MEVICPYCNNQAKIYMVKIMARSGYVSPVRHGLERTTTARDMPHWADLPIVNSDIGNKKSMKYSTLCGSTKQRKIKSPNQWPGRKAIIGLQSRWGLGRVSVTSVCSMLLSVSRLIQSFVKPEENTLLDDLRVQILDQQVQGMKDSNDLGQYMVRVHRMGVDQITHLHTLAQDFVKRNSLICVIQHKSHPNRPSFTVKSSMWPAYLEVTKDVVNSIPKGDTVQVNLWTGRQKSVLNVIYKEMQR